MDFAADLRKAGLRATQPRIAALTEVERNGHVTLEELRSSIIEQIGSVSIQAVYDVVHALTEKGLLREFRPVGQTSYFELNTGDNHHHLVCRRCGAIENVPCSTGYRPCLTASVSHGYVIDEAEVTYWGLCPACQKETDEKRTHVTLS